MPPFVELVLKLNLKGFHVGAKQCEGKEWLFQLPKAGVPDVSLILPSINIIYQILLMVSLTSASVCSEGNI